MDLKKEYCKLNGYTKFNKYNENNYTKFLEKKITELNQALQLQQTGVSGSNWFQKLPLHWRYIYYMIGGIIIGYLIHYRH